MAQQGMQVKIKMRIFPRYELAIDAARRGATDFARLGPVSYVVTKQQNPNIQLLAMESSHGEKFFNGVILVALNSPLKQLSDLKGKRFAFGEVNSTTGRYLAQEALMQAGITSRSLAYYEYVGRHDKVAFAVSAGNYDAGAVNESTLKKYGQSKGLRQLAAFRSPTHAWVARSGLDVNVVESLRKALLEMKGDALKYIGRDGFLPAQDAEFDSLRSSMLNVMGFDD